MIAGFDASHWEGTIEWPLVPDDYKFCFIKATEGGFPPDHLADQHWIGAGQQGLLRGAYMFWRYGAPAAAQANEFCSRISWLEAQGGKSELPPVIDLEDTRAPKGSLLLPHIRAVLQIVESFCGRKPIIYTSAWWSTPWLGDCSWMRPYPLWVASYTYNPSSGPISYSMPKGLTEWKFHQWTDNAEIPGIAENDECCDTFHGTLEELYTFANLTPPPTLEQRVTDLEKRVIALEAK